MENIEYINRLNIAKTELEKVILWGRPGNKNFIANLLAKNDFEAAVYKNKSYNELADVYINKMEAILNGRYR